MLYFFKHIYKNKGCLLEAKIFLIQNYFCYIYIYPINLKIFTQNGCNCEFNGFGKRAMP